MMNAKITKIELVNGNMLSFTLVLPSGKVAEDFCIEETIGGILNSHTDRKTGIAIVNSYREETDLRVGDEITTSGEIIEGNGDSTIEQVTIERQTTDYRDSYNEKNYGN